MLNNVFYIMNREDLAVIVKDKSLISALEAASSKIPKKDRRVKDMVVFCEKLLRESMSSVHHQLVHDQPLFFDQLYKCSMRRTFDFTC